MRLFRTVVTAAAFMAAALPLAAQDLPQPAGEVLLTVDGVIGRANEDGRAVFDRAMLEGLDPVTFETETIWTEGIQTFTGVPLGRLMDEVEADGDSVAATAVNDYSVTIPKADWAEGRAVVAYLRNGEEMSLREKGPLWIVYPYDSDPDLRSEDVFSRSIWQLDSITVNR